MTVSAAVPVTGVPPIDPDALVAAVAALRAADAPDGPFEEPRARALAALLEHPAIEVELQWVLARRPNLIARVRGRGEGPGLLLAGHFNAGFHPGAWRHDPRAAVLVDGAVSGGAVSDMLGGLAAMALALRAVADGGPPPGDVVLLAAMHEDMIGLGVKAALASRDDWPPYAIWGDPTDLGVVTEHGGAVKFELTARGRDAHVTRREEGADALAAAARIALAIGEGTPFRFEAEPRLPFLPRAVVGELHAGVAPGVVAAEATVRGDVRTVPGMTPATVLADLERLAADHAGEGIAVEVRAIRDQHPFLPERPPTALVAALSDALASRRGGRPPRVGSGLPAQAFCTEAADLHAAGIESVVCGPGDWRWAVDERVPLADLVAAAGAYAQVAATLAAPAQKPSRKTSLYSRYSDTSQPVA